MLDAAAEQAAAAAFAAQWADADDVPPLPELCDPPPALPTQAPCPAPLLKAGFLDAPRRAAVCVR